MTTARTIRRDDAPVQARKIDTARLGVALPSRRTS